MGKGWRLENKMVQEIEIWSLGVRSPRVMQQG